MTTPARIQESVLKSVKFLLRPARDHLLRVKGPTECSDCELIALESGGHFRRTGIGENTSFALPRVDSQLLVDFYSLHSDYTSPSPFVAVIPSGRIHAGGVVLSPYGRRIARDVSFDFGRSPSEHFLLNQRLRRPRRIRGRVLYTGVAGSSSYYHWLLDELPRILISKGEDRDILACSRDTGPMRDVLRILQQSPRQTIFTDHYDSSFRHYIAEDLIVPSYLSCSGEPTPRVMQLLKEIAENVVVPNLDYPARIYVSRQRAPTRGITYGASLLEALLHGKGYCEVFLEDLPWREQVNYFYHAREIVAPHGAGLANLAFCGHSPRVIEIFNPEYIHYCFWKLACMAGSHYTPLASDEVDPGCSSVGEAGIRVTAGVINELEKLL